MHTESKRGRRKNRPGYAERFAARQAQACPANKTRPVHKGLAKYPDADEQHKHLTGRA